jgi:hypothetical protein
MSARRQSPRADTIAVATARSMNFDAAFRARLRDLLVWRRDVRRFRRDLTQQGA